MLASLSSYYFKIYDNPSNNYFPVVYNGLTNSYATIDRSNVLGEDLVEINSKFYNTEIYYTKDGLKITEILSTLLSDTNFGAEVHVDLDNEYRSNLDYNNISIYQAVKSVASSFNAVVITDTITNTFYIYPDLVYGQNNNLIIKYGTYLKSLNKDIDSSKIVTAARAIGKDGLGIELVSPTQENL